MQHTQPRLARAGHGYGGEVHAVGDIAVFQVVDELIARHVRAVVLRFGRARAEVGYAENVFHAQKRLVGEVGDIARDLARFDRFDHVRAHDEVAARIVDDDHAVLALRKAFAVEHALGVGRERDVHGDEVRLAEQVGKLGRELHPSVHHPGVAHGEEGVVPDDVHAEAQRVVGDHGADRAQSDDAQRLARDLLPDKLGLALLDELGDVLLPVQGLRPVGAVDDLPAAQKQLAQDEFLDGVGVRARRIEDDDALFRTLIDGNVVDARARPRHGEQVFAEGIVVHRKGAQDDAVGVFDAVRIIIARKCIVCDGADRVEF